MHNPYELEIILDLINTDDDDLFITCVDSLRFLNLSSLDNLKKDWLLSKIENLLRKASPPVKRILEGLIVKIN